MENAKRIMMENIHIIEFLDILIHLDVLNVKIFAQKELRNKKGGDSPPFLLIH